MDPAPSIPIPPIPPQFWDFFFKFLVPLCTGVGFMSLLVVLIVLWKKGRLPIIGGAHARERRTDDPVMKELVTLVKENTVAFQALKSQGEDHKSISLKICGTLEEMNTSLALMNREMADQRGAGHHRRVA